MLGSVPPVSHLSPLETDALIRSREALLQKPLILHDLLAGVTHYVELQSDDADRPTERFLRVKD